MSKQSLSSFLLLSPFFNRFETHDSSFFTFFSCFDSHSSISGGNSLYRGVPLVGIIGRGGGDGHAERGALYDAVDERR